MGNIRKNQSGLVSLVVVMIIMIIVTLIAISFALITRREQRQALDRQLSTQAFYAAETGINDAVEALKANATAVGDINDCTDSQQNKVSPNRVLDAGTGVSATCVLVDQSPAQLVYTVGTDASKVFRVSAPGATKLYIFWQRSPVSGGGTTFAASGAGFPALSSWGASTPGVLEANIIPVLTTRALISAGTREVFGYPSTNASGTHNLSSSPNGQVLNGGCDAAGATNAPGSVGKLRQCMMIIDGIGAIDYYVRLKSIYSANDVTVVATDNSNNVIPISGAQVSIDATGKAGDVLKRIKVYRPVSNAADFPEYVLTVGDDLCKRLITNTSVTTTDTPAVPSCVPTYP